MRGRAEGNHAALPQINLLTQLSAATDPDDKKAMPALIDGITGRL